MWVVLQSSLAGAMTVRSGTYTGNGNASRSISGLGFRPEMVLIKSNSAVSPALATSSMPVGEAKTLNGAMPLETDVVLSLDADGFTVGGTNRVNGAGTAVYWVAFAGTGLRVTSYTGNGNDDRAITGLGFAPLAVWVIPDTTETGLFRTASMPTETCYFFNNFSGTNRIQALLADGFEVGDDIHVNQNGTRYHVVAFGAASGAVAQGLYTGNGSDGRRITTNVDAQWVMTRVLADARGVHRTASVSGDATLFLSSDSNAANGIQAIESGGHRLGTSADVNASGSVYTWLSIGVPSVVDAGPPDSGSADAGTFDAGPPDAGAADAGDVDAGANDDGGFETDGGALADAGATDAGPSLGGDGAGQRDGGADGGLETEISRLEVGCGCQASGVVWAPLLLAVLALRKGARRKGSR